MQTNEAALFPCALLHVPDFPIPTLPRAACQHRWSDGSDGRPKSWYIDVDEGQEAAEIAFLRSTIYLREVDPRVQALSATVRYSTRV